LDHTSVSTPPLFNHISPASRLSLYPSHLPLFNLRLPWNEASQPPLTITLLHHHDRHEKTFKTTAGGTLRHGCVFSRPHPFSFPLYTDQFTAIIFHYSSRNLDHLDRTYISALGSLGPPFTHLTPSFRTHTHPSLLAY